MAVRAWLLLAAVVGVTLTHAHIIRLDAGESECLYEEFGAEHLLEGEDQQTVPTEVALAFIVRAHKIGRKTISNPVSVNASDPYGNLLVQKSGAHEEVRVSELNALSPRVADAAVGRSQAVLLAALALWSTRTNSRALFWGLMRFVCVWR